MTDEAGGQGGRPFKSNAVDFIEGDLGFGRAATPAPVPARRRPAGPATTVGMPPGATTTARVAAPARTTLTTPARAAATATTAAGRAGAAAAATAAAGSRAAAGCSGRSLAGAAACPGDRGEDVGGQGPRRELRRRGRLGRPADDQHTLFDRRRVGVNHLVIDRADRRSQAVDPVGTDREVAHKHVDRLGTVAVGGKQLDGHHVVGTELGLAEIARLCRLGVDT